MNCRNVIITSLKCGKSSIFMVKWICGYVFMRFSIFTKGPHVLIYVFVHMCDCAVVVSFFNLKCSKKIFRVKKVK